jgi:ATP-dependent Clp protease adaptor protein ClpS
MGNGFTAPAAASLVDLLGQEGGLDYACPLRHRDDCCEPAMTNKTLEKPRTKVKPKTQRPPLYKVILLNDDYTPREFVVLVLKAVFRMNEDQAYRVMMTAHRRGACVIAVYARDVAETKAKEATELGKSKGYPLFFTTEPEE